MAAGDTDIGTGTTVSAAGAGAYAAEVLSVSWSDMSREAIDVSHMGTTGGRDFIPSDLYDPGVLTLEVHFKTTLAVPISAADTAITITFPDAETWVCDGFVTGFEFNDPMEDKMTATITYKLTGDITF